MQKIVPVLWFESDAPAIVQYYKDIFGNDISVDGQTDLNDTPTGQVQVITIKLGGMDVRIMAAGKHDQFNDSISFEVTCKDQSEIDRLWNALTANGGQEQQCGWCIDKYGVRWQIVPEDLGNYINTPAGMQAMLQMKKLVIEDLKKANSSQT